MPDFRFCVDEVSLFERPVKFRMPFRYGIVTLEAAPEVYVRVRISTADGATAEGISADLLAPKWFDKSTDFTNEQNFEQLRKSVLMAADRYVDPARIDTAFGHHAAHEEAHHAACVACDLPGLVASFGIAQIDRAILDACCRVRGISVFDAIRTNLPAITAATAPDLDGFDIAQFLSTLTPKESIDIRHTVGLTDAIWESDIADEDRIGDGLPQSLEANCKFYGLRSFKIKLCGDAEADIARLAQIAEVLETQVGDYFCTLDGNEQFEDAKQFLEFWHTVLGDPQLEKLARSVQIVEQPINRLKALEAPLGVLGDLVPVEIDESDADIDAFPKAIALGYRGVSSKSCKGIYRSLLNRARVEMLNQGAGGEAGAYFMSAEDLSTQAGVALQQDLSLASLIGCTHIERNGHQYGDGLSGISAPWRKALQAAHPDMYVEQGERLCLDIRKGKIDLRSLQVQGFGVLVSPPFDDMRCLAPNFSASNFRFL
ncbi:hypothetical protein [Thalassospira alkalitolerans]|uniref:hypothetical protein n=1 Tax=Thalassospira alkalitolerans TaxID=1293890 RepID=UPI003AA86CA1